MNGRLSTIERAYFDFLNDREFPCIGAKAALANDTVDYHVAHHLGLPDDDREILQFLYVFVDYLRSRKTLFSSAVVLFEKPSIDKEEIFENLFWQRLQALADLDAQHYSYDRRVSNDSTSVHFSFSLKEEAFYVIGLHPASSRKARRFGFPAMVFNPHNQFVALRERGKYEPMRSVVRKRDVHYSGSVNPMLADFGESSEAFQYSGQQYDKNWKCPFRSKHKDAERDSAA